jgi:hypothetical protein
MLDDDSWPRYQVQRFALVTELPSWLLARLASQAARPGRLALEPI